MILALAGGVGGAKLANGLAAILDPDTLTIAVNTGDDFDHLGLRICPDIDTITYTLAGRNNRELGWGLEGESWAFMDMLGTLGGETWFRLGDRDMATHVLRTMLLHEHSLSTVTAQLATRLGIRHRIVPMSDDPMRSMVLTDEGELPFQDYFVRRQCAPRFHSIRFDGIETARPSQGLMAALDDPALTAIILCPSNPLLSIAPILAVPSVRERLEQRRVPLVAVSPFIGGKAVKGPAAKIMMELDLPTTAATIADHYGALLDGLVIDGADSASAPANGPALLVTNTLMRDSADQARLAQETVAFAATLTSPNQ
jgi:LPPG:FO 2-phospho-L-lactate transferase